MGARLELLVGQIIRTGLAAQTPTAGVIPDGHKFANNGRTYMRVAKASTSGTITFRTPKKILGLDLAELAVLLAGSGATVLIGPFPTNVFNQADGMVYVDYESGEESEFTVEVYSI